jgi:type II secretory pathway component GspD/PulD (secretin)
MSSPVHAALRAAIVMVLLVGAGLSATARAQELQIIDLNYRLAQDLIPILAPLVEPGGVLTGTDDVLFVRTSPANFEQIRAAVATLDRAPRELLISVGQGTVRDVDAARAKGSATIGGADVQVGVNRPPADGNSAELRVASRQQQADLHNVSSVRALEGNETWIGAGQSVPLTETTVQHRPGGVVQQTTTYHDVSTGFYAIARLRDDDRVTLEISPRQQRYRPSSSGGVVSTQGATTSVTARLGEWFELGGVEESGSASSEGLLVWGGRDAASRYSVWVKVEEIPR